MLNYFTVSANAILYLHMIRSDTCQHAKLDGIRRYAAARGWRVEAVPREASRARMVPAIIERRRPLGCIVEGAGRWDDLPPSLFGRTPVIYIDVLNEQLCGAAPRIILDPELVARYALRELSASHPSSYGAVGFVRQREWSDFRIRAFQSLVEAQGQKCHILTARKGEGIKSYLGRINDWVKNLPRGCAIFAVQGPTATNVADAARRHFRDIPRDLTLLTTIGTEREARLPHESISTIQFDFERIGYLAARMLDEWMHGRRQPHTTERMGPLFTLRRESTRGRGRREPRILEAAEMIRREACDGLTARALAARFPGSRRLFDMRFREAMGHSVLDEILHVRMEKAFILLAQTDTAIGAIPALCGFGCDSTLDVLFRTRCGMSMREWRKRNAWRR